MHKRNGFVANCLFHPIFVPVVGVVFMLQPIKSCLEPFKSPSEPFNEIDRFINSVKRLFSPKPILLNSNSVKLNSVNCSLLALSSVAAHIADIRRPLQLNTR